MRDAAGPVGKKATADPSTTQAQKTAPASLRMTSPFILGFRICLYRLRILLDQSDIETIGGQNAGQQAQCAVGREAGAKLGGG